MKDRYAANLELGVRLWPRVDKTDGCWLWRGHRIGGRGKYGSIRRAGREELVHRVVYELLVGPIPKGLTLDHLCRVTTCVNPAHLEPVTSRENTLRGQGPTALNASKTHCVAGHAFSEENTYVRLREGHRSRLCRACRRVNNERYLERKYAPRPTNETVQR